MRAAYPRARPGYPGPVTARSDRLPAALVLPDPGRLDPATGLWSFTAAYLWERGTCCDSGCRHCPYVNRRARLSGS